MKRSTQMLGFSPFNPRKKSSMSSFHKPEPVPLSDEGEMDLIKVQRVNQSWIVHGHLRDTAIAWIEHLQRTDAGRLEKSCWLALFLTRYKKSILRDPKPLFYAGLFAFATREEADWFLSEHPMTLAITLLGLGDDSGLDELRGQALDLATGVAAEIREIRACE
ncbi:MAG: hypothetical protein EOP84_13750 [Verrucomicrobiaceae bacterium]|nr:MAG: hypothetical protein EOP84_13750 [Verrucomicrobiaceae bacterium]